MIINKTDLVSKEALGRLEQTLERYNLKQKMIKTVNSEVDLSEVLNTQLFDFEKASESADGSKSLQKVVMNIIRLKQRSMEFHHLFIAENSHLTQNVLKIGSIIYLAIS